ncbi:MAG TPA: ABC transporter ATP-binding protein [Chlamydiales bacterium]|nr:ABC transporter ATP-binding protein [Chlamydiales bacterium]
MTQPVLIIKELTKVYGSKKPFTAVDGISFELKRGEILGLLGPNGSGKTTTIQMLLGLLSSTSGSITYFGREFPRHRSEILQHVSFASTYSSLPPLLSIDENLNYFGLLYGVTNAKERATPLLDRFGILDKRKETVSSLSAGQMTRLMLVKAFFTDPKIVLLDEPTASLDPDISRDVCKFLLEQRDQKGISVLFTSHKMDEVSEICDRAIFLKQGKIIANDLPGNLAKSVSTFQLRLTITDGMKRTAALAEARNLVYQIDHRVIQLSLQEAEIPSFLNALMKADVSYAKIQIEEPSLDDYFIKISERKK